MNILMITQSYDAFEGGIERVIHNLRMKMERDGHIVYIIAPSNLKVSPDPRIYRVNSLRLKGGTENVNPIGLILNHKSLDFLSGLDRILFKNQYVYRSLIPFSPYQDIINWLSNKNIDIIHCHTSFSMGHLAFKLRKDLKCPLVFTIHSMYNLMKYKFHMEGLNVDADMVDVIMGNNSDHVTAPSHYVLQNIVNKGMTAPATIIPSGTDPDEFYRIDNHERKIFRHGFLIGTLSRLDREKNLELLYSVVLKFMRMYPNVSFLAVGKGDMRQYGIDLFTQAGFANRIYFPGSLSGNKVREAFNDMDCFIYTSVSETQGLVLNEAAMCGVPMVVLYSEVSAEFVERDQIGYNEKDLLNILNRYYTDHTYRKVKSEFNLVWAQRYTLDNCTAKLYEIYEIEKRR